MARKWKVIARHKTWVLGATITESIEIDSEKGMRRFTATIRGWNNWRIWQGETAGTEMKPRVYWIKDQVERIRRRIDAGDQSVFSEPNDWAKGPITGP